MGMAVALLLSGWMLFVLLGVGPALGFQTTQQANSPKKKNESSRPRESEPVKNPPDAVPSHAVPVPDVQQVKQVDSAQTYASQEPAFLLRLQRTEFESRTAKLTALLDMVEPRLQKQQRRIDSLLKNDEGRRLVPVARQVRFLLAKLQSAAADLQQRREEITAVREAFLQAAVPLTDLDPYDRQLAHTATKLHSVTSFLDLFDSALDELLAEAPATATGPTLDEALMALNVPAEDEARRIVSEKERVLRMRHAEAIAAAQEQLDSLRDRLEIAKTELRQSETEAEKRLSDAKTQQAEQQRELDQKRQAARKRMEQALPDFQSRLSPFITKGYRQVNTRHQFATVIEAQPLSYSALVRVGALNDSAAGLEILLMMGHNHQFRGMNDRPSGDFPKYTSEFDIKKPEVIQELKAIQAFLREHGEAMVDAKLLTP